MRKDEERNNNKLQGAYKIIKRNKKYITLACLFTCSFIILFVVIYFVFLKCTFIPTGKNLEKRDWLSFVGTYFSLMGAFLVSLVAILQTKYYNKQENARRDHERQKRVEPIFSIKIVDQDTQVGNHAVIFNPSNPATFPKFDNFTISVENLSEFPALHVCVFNEYLFPALKPGEVKKIQAAFADSNDVRKYKNGFQAILDADEEQEDRLPKSFNISYEDVDGRSAYKIYDLSRMNDTKYYSLTKTEVTWDVV